MIAMIYFSIVGVGIGHRAVHLLTRRTSTLYVSFSSSDDKGVCGFVVARGAFDALCSNIESDRACKIKQKRNFEFNYLIRFHS